MWLSSSSSLSLSSSIFTTSTCITTSSNNNNRRTRTTHVFNSKKINRKQQYLNWSTSTSTSTSASTLLYSFWYVLLLLLFSSSTNGRASTTCAFAFECSHPRSVTTSKFPIRLLRRKTDGGLVTHGSSSSSSSDSNSNSVLGSPRQIPFRPSLSRSSNHLIMAHFSSMGGEGMERTEQIEDSKDNKDKHKNKNMMLMTMIANMYTIAGIGTIISWIYTSYVALSFHPDPKFIDCTLRHNILTMSQAFAFPLPIAYASFRVLYMIARHEHDHKNDRFQPDNNNCRNNSLHVRDGDQDDSDLGSSGNSIGRRINLGVALASTWLAGATSLQFAPNFAFGYDLYSTKHKIMSTLVHAATAMFALGVAFVHTKTSVGKIIRGVIDSLWNLGPTSRYNDYNSNNNNNENNSSNNSNNNSLHGRNNNSALYATGTIGLLWFTVLPIVSPFPLATIPTILGKRLSRPASAFTLLGAIIAYCLKDNKESSKPTSVSSVAVEEEESMISIHRSIRRTLRNGLLRGSGAHLLLIFLKLIGVDGGGWIFPGNGLQEVYPAMISVPFATGVSLAVHAILCFAAWSDNDED